MRIVSLATAVTGALAFAMAASQPVQAGPACNRLGLPNNCIKSNDLQSRLTLREAGRDGRLQIRDAANETSFNLNGASGNATNLFSNLEDESNGLVKAWAQIAADGTVVACWRCDPAETDLIVTGQYEVDFTPLATDITGRPRSATLDGHSTSTVADSTATLADRTGDPSSVFVRTHDQTGAFADRPFVLIIY